MKVRVYKNLHRNCWSVQQYIKGKGWRLWNYYFELVICNPKFIVYEKGRQRVIKTGKKNVHAYVEGDLDLISNPWHVEKRVKLPPKFRPDYHQKIKYDPYKNSFFEMNGIKPDRELTEVYLDIDYGVYI